nr:MAG TPA_asm: hypothetical protein [Caudoviricetes sp.]
MCVLVCVILSSILIGPSFWWAISPNQAHGNHRRCSLLLIQPVKPDPFQTQRHP